MLLKDRVALVYGASGAVGGAVARAFAREGALVVLAARRREPLEETAAAIRASGGQAEVAPVDVRDPGALAAHLEGITARLGRVRVMFNAVSWDDVQGEPLAVMPVENVMRPVTLGLTTWLHTGSLLARHMGANGGGVILGITANAGREPVANVGGFGIACAAVEHFLRQLAVENGPMGVRVCWVRSPGSPDAPGVRDVWAEVAKERGISFEELHADFAKTTPLRKITALAQVADAAVLLASDLAAGMTATLANATGGSQID